jgi:chaperone modulatory protein CbpM
MTRNESARRRLPEAQVIRSSGVTTTELRVWCDSGWVVPARGENGGQVFDDLDVARVCLVRELRHELGLDDEAIPVVLSLLDQLYGVRRELRALARAVEQQDRDVAARIRAAYRALAEDG